MVTRNHNPIIETQNIKIKKSRHNIKVTKSQEKRRKKETEKNYKNIENNLNGTKDISTHNAIYR